jgi:hypothetical protein
MRWYFDIARLIVAVLIKARKDEATRKDARWLFSHNGFAISPFT